MTGCRVKRIQKYITGETFMITYGDGVANVDVRRLAEFHKSHGKIGTVTAVRPPARFGEIEVDGSRVADFAEKPLLSRGRINGGFFVFNHSLFDRLPDDPSLMLEHAPLTGLARDGELMAYLHDDFWQPMDNSREYKYLNELWAEGKAPWKCWGVPPLRLAA
jgi:glucose-1-phosphate cytidylyltransferase